MSIGSSPRLKRFYGFFETYGTVRLNGLDESYFRDLSDWEREEAWNFLVKNAVLSEEAIKGLYILDKERAIKLFKDVIATPLMNTESITERKELEVSRLVLLNYINNVEPDVKYVNAMCDFANSAFEEVRSLFASSLPISPVTSEAVDALKRMIFTEVERAPLALAITKYMAIHGMDFDMENPMYESIYRSLRSENPLEKMSGMKRLQRVH